MVCSGGSVCMTLSECVPSSRVYNIQAPPLHDKQYMISLLRLISNMNELPSDYVFKDLHYSLHR
jgi:hypothetical protein